MLDFPTASRLLCHCRALLAALALVALGGCAGNGLLLHDHPLAGHIVDPAAGQPVALGAALERMSAADVVLLGEVHDNPIHHRLQLKVLQQLSQARRLALAMEQFDSEHQAALTAAQADPDATAETLADAGQLSREGWGWPLYQPLVSEAVARGLPVIGINLSRPEARQVARDGFDAMPAGAGRDAVERHWNPERQKTMEGLITDGHCGQVDARMLGMIVQAQRARDAVMAARIAPYADRGVVAILGGGHARVDLAVPAYLGTLAPGRRVLSVGMIEVREGADSAADYPAVRDRLYDLVWFTPRFERPDPCEALSRAGMARAMKKN
ncbi:MAG: ChaN family lipoprotein [Rhodocyclaceae bacterium]|nr:ChaN family lipoprotein [Rhodocyclaceae bacterium]